MCQNVNYFFFRVCWLSRVTFNWELISQATNILCYSVKHCVQRSGPSQILYLHRAGMAHRKYCTYIEQEWTIANSVSTQSRSGPSQIPYLHRAGVAHRKYCTYIEQEWPIENIVPTQSRSGQSQILYLHRAGVAHRKYRTYTEQYKDIRKQIHTKTFVWERENRVRFCKTPRCRFF
jgi:hypothetical protein